MVENSTSTNENFTIGELLEYLEYKKFDITIYQFVIPVIGFIGFILCFINVWIYFKSQFNSRTYQYYRFMNIIYVIGMLFSIPYGFCFTPAYFPNMNSYKCAILQSVYIPYTSYTFHIVGIVEMSILLERMKIFSSLVRKHFIIAPINMCLISIVVCLCIDGFSAFVYLPVYGGDYYYIDEKGTLNVNSFYYVDSSELARSFYGSIILNAIYVMRDMFTMISTVTLNIVSLIQMKQYYKNKIHSFKPNIIIMNGIRLQLNKNLNISDQNEKTRISERNHLKMVIILCLISIIVRSVSITCEILYLYYPNYIAIIFGTLADLFLVIGPAISFGVFYNFDMNFKKKVLTIFFGQTEKPPGRSGLSNFK